jgi:hypothetical protein
MSKITPLYYANFFVDQVQDAKNTAVETFIVDDKMAAPIKSFVEAQRIFTKELNRSMFQFTDNFVSSTKSVFDKFSK